MHNNNNWFERRESERNNAEQSSKMHKYTVVVQKFWNVPGKAGF